MTLVCFFSLVCISFDSSTYRYLFEFILFWLSGVSFWHLFLLTIVSFVSYFIFDTCLLIFVCDSFDPCLDTCCCWNFLMSFLTLAWFFFDTCIFWLLTGSFHPCLFFIDTCFFWPMSVSLFKLGYFDFCLYVLNSCLCLFWQLSSHLLFSCLLFFVSLLTLVSFLSLF